MIGNDTVVLIVPVERDIHGDPIPGTGTERQVDGASVAPVRTDEDENRASTVTGRATALLPFVDAAGVRLDETEIKPDMLLRWRGREYEIVGDAMPWTYLDGEEAALEVSLRYGRD